MKGPVREPIPVGPHVVRLRLAGERAGARAAARRRRYRSASPLRRMDRGHRALHPRARSRRDRGLMPNLSRAALGALALLLLPIAASHAQGPIECPACAEWNAPQRPLRLHGNTYYVGTHGLGAILITSPQGHVLIDGGLPQSAPIIRANVESLGFRMRDVKLILNSHAHYDHAGGIAELQRASGARVLASAWSARVLKRRQVAARRPAARDRVRLPRREQRGDVRLRRHAPRRSDRHRAARDGRPHAGRHVLVLARVRRRALPRLRLRRQPDARLGGRLPVHEEHGLPERARRLPARPRDARAAVVRRARHAASRRRRRSGTACRRATARSGPAFVDRGACTRYAATARQQLEERIERERGRPVVSVT